MRKNNVIFNPQADLMIGVNTVADAVETTLGAKGLAVGIAKQAHTGEVYERQIVVDGVTVAQSIQLANEAQNFGAQVLIEAAKKQRDTVGDGTSVTIALARAILTQAAPIIAAGTNPQSVVAQIEAGITKLVKEVENAAQKTKTADDLIKIATISAKDEALGRMIGQIVYDLGVEGTVTSVESKSPTTTLDHQKGMQLDHGFYNSYFATNETGDEATLDFPAILVTDLTIQSLLPLAGMLNEFVSKQKKLVILSPDISPEAWGRLIEQKMLGTLLPLCIKAPSFGANQKEILQDIAILTGATYIASDAGMSLDSVTIKDLGSCKSISATKTETIIAGGLGKKKEIATRIEALKKSIDHADSEFDKAKREERLGKLTSGVAVIHVGGHTEVEMKERRERVLDGIAAAKAALKGGIVPGGEMIYLTIREKLDQTILGEKILYTALEQPFRRLVGNAGYDGGQLLEKIRKGKHVFAESSGLTPEDIAQIDMDDPQQAILVQGDISKAIRHIGGLEKGMGINVETGKMTNLLAAGIIDPAAVPANALLNGASVACQLLITKVLIIPDDQQKHPNGNETS